MAPNAAGNTVPFQQSDEQNSTDQDSEERQCVGDDTDLKTHRDIDRAGDKSTVSLSFSNVSLKFNLLQLLFLIKYYIKITYIFVWHELSMDPRVRSNPYVEPPENEVKLSWSDSFTIRRRRIFFIFIHLMALLGLYYCLTGRVRVYTILWTLMLGAMSSIGVTAGAHRLWSHHSFKATWQLRLILMIFQTLGVQYSVYNWARDHRLHHKHTDTDADPHNSNRGFFFSHIGWSVILPHPDVENKIKTIDMKDMEHDHVVMFQYKYYVPLSIIFAYLIPTVVPWYFWNESLWISHLVAAQLRQVLTLHGTFLINSAAHMWGTKPYDKNINPTENMFVSAASFGDGWHNYHHVFPWDYRNSELWDYKLNISTAFVDLFALIGWAYDLKTVPAEIVSKRVKRTGDGTHHVWGWNDADLPAEDRKLADVLHKRHDD